MVVVSCLSGAAMYDYLQNGLAIKSLGRLILPRNEGTVQNRKSAAIVPVNVVAPAVNKAKPINTASLIVRDVSGEANSPIPLSLKVIGNGTESGVEFRLTGLPDKAYLTAGRKEAQSWSLKTKEADKVELVVPDETTPNFTVNVIALKAGSDELVSPMAEMHVQLKEAVKASATPASVPLRTLTDFSTGSIEPLKSAAISLQPMPGAQNSKEEVPQTPAPTAEDVQKLIEYGDSLMETGDLAAARSYYARAYSLGNPVAALRLGKTYDPTVFVEKKVQGLKPDTAAAVHYYQLAAAAGIPEAKTLILVLQMKLVR
jgi:hypothetical protein